MISRQPLRRASIRARRGGHLVAEAFIIIPILLLISIAVVEIGLIVSLKQSVAHAAIRAAREWSKGATVDDIDVVVEEALSGFFLDLDDNVGYAIEDEQKTPSVVVSQGVIYCDLPTSDLSTTNIRVTVCASSSGSLVSGLIARFGGPDLMNEICTHSAVAKKECPALMMTN